MKNLCSEIFFNSKPYNHILVPSAFTKPYENVRIVQDVNEKWYTIRSNRQEINDWIIDQSDGWRYAANSRFKDYWQEENCYDLREDVYTWFILRWK